MSPPRTPLRRRGRSPTDRLMERRAGPAIAPGFVARLVPLEPGDVMNCAPTLPFRRTSSRLIAIGLRAGMAAFALTGAVGALHLPFAAPLLRQIFPGSVCPVMRGTPEQIDRA